MLNGLIIGFVILVVVFVPMERRWALHREQPVFRRGWSVDVVHFFVDRVLILVGTYLLAVPLYLVFSQLLHNPLQAAIARQPAWQQFLEGLVVAELAFYVIHRLSHTIPWLWKFHAVHHSIEAMDWLASVRLHPGDLIIANLAVGIPLLLLGFSDTTFGVYTIWSTFQAFFVHANVRFHFGPLRWIIPSPEFHHWHHANEPEAINKNFGAPLIDLLFGTAYMPKGRWPRLYGINERIELKYLKHLAYPFKKS